jgi:excisionase family DNA binding protein
MRSSTPATLPDPAVVPLLTLEETAKILRIGRSKSYELAQRNALPCPVVRVGTSYRVPTHALLKAIRLT